ncbi:glutamyl-tRNA reductase [Pseudoflavonifractor capillosus]|uniref:glutamyl-tRNA reductase n=1 Tax=Pseudoflavonifractor capillosus TaxID=106588 RepID=UPI00195BF7BB|nr:glutamyl-tRNA reductase [Pseudoflavonifractor capillosus]MBM6897931.1 glutamyl-tRNA reductase [Pseudoflavonifractor capillosus]
MIVVMSSLEHHLAPIDLREALSFTATHVQRLNAQIAALPNIHGCVILSTCNRTEIYLCCADTCHPGQVLCHAAGVDFAPFSAAFVTCQGEDAVEHLMQVAAGLRSRVWGEDQILAQVKRAITLARDSHSTHPMLETLFRSAISAGKEIRSTVRLTALPTSAASQGVELLRQHLGSLKGLRAMVIGNGEMGKLSAQLLHQAGCQVMVTLRTYRHGETVVPSGCEAQPYDRRFELLGGVDVLISATASPHYTVTVERLAQVGKLPRAMVDLAIPRDIEPQVGQLPGVKLFNVDDLMDTSPLHTVPQEVQEILDKYQRQFYRWFHYKVSLPLMEELKLSIVQRLTANPQLMGEELEPDERIALTVQRTVELLVGGLPTPPEPDSLRQCAQKIRAHTTGKG